MKYDLEIMNEQYGAGTTYGWDRDKYGIRGVGIASYRFNSKPRLKIKIRGNIWGVRLDRVKEFIKTYPQSTHVAKGVKLWVIPMSIMEVINEAPYVPKYVAPIVEEKQPKLF